VEIDAPGLWANPTLAARTKTRRGWGPRPVVENEAPGRWARPTLRNKREGWGIHTVTGSYFVPGPCIVLWAAASCCGRAS